MRNISNTILPRNLVAVRLGPVQCCDNLRVPSTEISTSAASIMNEYDVYVCTCMCKSRPTLYLVQRALEVGLRRGLGFG